MYKAEAKVVNIVASASLGFRMDLTKFSKMFDNNESYEGKLVFDSAAGKIKSYSEKLDASWLAVDPAAGKANPNGVPAALTMSVVKGFSIEKVN